MSGKAAAASLGRVCRSGRGTSNLAAGPAARRKLLSLRMTSLLAVHVKRGINRALHIEAAWADGSQAGAAVAAGGGFMHLHTDAPRFERSAIPLQQLVRLSSMLCNAWGAALLLGLLALAQGRAATRSLPHSRALEQDNGSAPAQPQPEIELPGPSAAATSGSGGGGSQAQPAPECFVTVNAGAVC